MGVWAYRLEQVRPPKPVLRRSPAFLMLDFFIQPLLLGHPAHVLVALWICGTAVGVVLWK